jgi:glycosyltransferase involved in cell wall biosynthesis
VHERAKIITNITLHLTGDISREELNKIYAKAHILILPSKSESFPKVVAEAAAYGCIPVTTSLSAITKKIIHGANGFLMNGNNPQIILHTLNEVANNTELKNISKSAINMSGLFTYERFRQRMSEIYNI